LSVNVKASGSVINASKIEELISSFDKDRNYFGPYKTSEEGKNKLRTKFISDFPPNSILDMKIDDYVFGKIDPETGNSNKSTFCHRLEFEMERFGGIRGTPATKFGIYYDKKSQKCIYDQKKYDSPESAFKRIKFEIDAILKAANQLTKDNDWGIFAKVLEGDFDILISERVNKIMKGRKDFFRGLGRGIAEIISLLPTQTQNKILKFSNTNREFAEAMKSV
jgi:hypothetical protein